MALLSKSSLVAAALALTGLSSAELLAVIEKKPALLNGRECYSKVKSYMIESLGEAHAPTPGPAAPSRA